MLATYISIFRYGLCQFKNTRHTVDRWTPILAGFLSTFAILWEPAHRRHELVLYLLPKSLEAFWKFLQKRNLVKSLPNGEVLIFAIGMAIIMYCYQNEDKCIKSSYLSILQKFYGVN